MAELEAQLRAYGSVLDRADAMVADVIESVARPRHRALIVGIAAAVVVAAVAATVGVVATRSGDGPSPKIITPGTTLPKKTSPTTVPAVAPSPVLAIGDSVMEGAQGALDAAIPGIRVDAAKSRQFHNAISIVSTDSSVGTPPGTVVVALGTNGRITSEELDAFMRGAGELEVYFVTVRVPRSWETEVNSSLRIMPNRWPNAHVIEWHDYSTTHDDWFVQDGFHLTATGQRAYAAFIAAALGHRAPSTDPSVLPVVDVITKSALPPVPLAIAGGLVWIATRNVGASSLSVQLEGRNPATTDVVKRIDVPQEAVFAIAGDGDSLWVAGGGDGGVPETTVALVDVRANKVVFTKTLTGTPCACPIFAGSAGVWLVGNGSPRAYHLSPIDGHVVSSVHFSNHESTTAMEIGARLVVGLDTGAVDVIDPARNGIEHEIPAPVIGDPPVEKVVAMSPAAIPAVGSDPAVNGLVVRANGTTSALFATGWQLNEIIAVDTSPATVTEAGGLMWLLGQNLLEVASTHAVVSNKFAYDPKRARVDRFSNNSVVDVGSGFRDAVSAEHTVWAVYDDGSGQPTIVVVKAPEPFPFK